MVIFKASTVKHRLLLTIFFLFASFSLATAALAHQPHYVTDNQIVLIKNPGVSQAFYGELKGQPAYYLIDLKKSADLYFQILVPALPDIRKDKTVMVNYVTDLDDAAAPSSLSQKASNFIKLDPALAIWQSFYEAYAGDNYWAGPEMKKEGQAGYYIIKVTSPDDTGKYVLVVGDKDEVTVPAIAKALITIPQLKTKFFNKPIWQSFAGKLGQYSGLGLLILLIIGYLFYKFHRVYR